MINLARVGVFYDGNYFAHVSNFYLYQHARKARISIDGLHNFILNEVAKVEDTASHHCRIVDAHYFRGRLSASEAQSRNVLYGERAFDEVLMRAGVITHFSPLSRGGEKGVDVSLALEVFELAIHKRFDVVVLIAGDGDYLPLIRKVNTIGARVMVLGWDFEFTDNQGGKRTTRTAQTILDEATYPVLMSSVIDDRSRKNDSVINDLFLSAKAEPHTINSDKPSDKSQQEGSVVTLNEGFGFISPKSGGDNLFFHHSDIENVDFNSLEIQDDVSYEVSSNNKGPCAKLVVKLQ